MSLSAEKKHVRNELTAGVHLAMIHSMKKYLDSQKNPLIVDDELAIVVTFVTGTNPNLYHDQIYWIGKGSEGKEKYFTRMCIDAGIDMSKTPLKESDARNKRLWIAVRDVYTLVDNGENIKKDITGADIIERFIFATSPVFDPEKVPTWKGDPAKNDGIAMDEFVSYKEDNETGYDTISEKAPEQIVEVVAMTQEIEATMEAELAKIKKEVKKKTKKAMDELIVKGEAKIEMLVPNFGEETTTPAPNFTEPTQTIKPTHTPNFGDNESPDDNF